MNWFKNWKIRTKILSIVIMMVLFIGILGFANYHYETIEDINVTSIYSDNLMSAKYLNDARAQYKTEGVAMFRFLLATDKDTQQAQENKIKISSDNYDKSYSAYMKTPSVPYETEKKQQLQTELTTYRSERQIVMDTAKQGDQKGAYDYLVKNDADRLDLINATLQELVDFNVKEADDAYLRIAAVNDMSTKIFLGISIIVGLMCLILGLAVAGLISNSLKKVLASVERVSAGDFSIDDIIIQGNDEVGLLATSFNTMKNNLLELVTELRITKDRLQDAQDFAHLGYWELDAISEEYYWSNELFRLYGCKPQKFTPTVKGFLEIVHPNDRELMINAMKNPLNGNESDLDIRIIRTDNKMKWIQIKIKYEYDTSGKMTRRHGVVQDITQRKLSEIKLKESEEKFKELAENLGEVIWVSQEEQLLYISPAYERVWGRTCQSMYDNPNSFLEAIHSDDKERIMQAYSAEINTSKGFFDEQYKIIRPDGTIRWIWRRSMPICSKNGRTLRRVGIAGDITEIKEYEESLRQAMEAAETANKAKSMFLANMSHELRTPLNGILGMSELLGMNLQDEQKEMAEIINTCGKNLLNIINDILDLSKIEAGKVRLIEEEFDVYGLVNEVSDVIQTLAEQKGLESNFYINGKIKGHLMGDSGRIKQVLFNLLGNAIKFTRNGSVELSVSKGIVLADKLQLVFTVKDTGIGIADDKIGQLFTSFMQIDDSYTKNFRGAGLGLAISKQLASMMDGEINVESKLGVGSNFTFSAIFKFKSDIKESIKIEKKEILQMSSANATVLLVEDDYASGVLMTKLCELKNINLKIATSGKQALEILERVSFEIIFMDIQMPGMSGYETTKLIREREEKLHKHTPIIATTAYALVGDREKCVETGMDDYLKKPIKAEEFYSIFNKHLSKEVDS